MASEVYSFQVTVPAGTAQNAPFRQSLTLPVRKVDTLEIVVPPGPSGQMGFAITMGGINVMPIQSGQYIVTDDQKISWPITDLPTSGAWQLTGYNTDVWPHSVYLWFLVDQVDRPTAGALLGITSMQALSGP